MLETGTVLVVWVRLSQFKFTEHTWPRPVEVFAATGPSHRECTVTSE